VYAFVKERDSNEVYNGPTILSTQQEINRLLFYSVRKRRGRNKKTRSLESLVECFFSVFLIRAKLISVYTVRTIVKIKKKKTLNSPPKNFFPHCRKENRGRPYFVNLSNVSAWQGTLLMARSIQSNN